MTRNRTTAVALLVALAVLVGACAQPAQVPPVQVEDSGPAVEAVSPTVEEPTAVMEEPTAVMEEPTAVMEEPTAVMEEPTAVVEEPASAAEDAEPAAEENAESPDPLVTGLEGASGSAVGPDGALYVTEGQAGRVSRVDPQTGETTALIEGLPPAVLPIGGAVDVAFLDGTAYVLVTMVGADLPVEVETPGVVGIYRVDGPDSFTVVADIGQWSIDNPSESEVFIPSGVYYAMQPFDDGFLVTDGHHNRLLYVTLDGAVSEMMAFSNIVPTGLAVAGETVYVAEAGPNPHLPEDGRIVQIGPEASAVSEVASGAPLLVDVEIGSDGVLYALAQGNFPEGADDGSPAMPDTGSLVAVNEDGAFRVVADGLNQPTSLEFIGNTAYVVTLTGEVWAINGAAESSAAGAKLAAIDPMEIGDTERGNELFVTGGGVLSSPCIRCHKLEEGGSERWGPSMYGVAQRAGSRVPGQNAVEYVRQSIVDPSAYLVEGFTTSMSDVYDLLLSEDDIDALVAFVLTQ